MKILKIVFQNINSLEGKHCVDFQDERFTQSNLFAITGPTGSGKSTILDVISLGIYNQIPRIDKVSSKKIQENGAVITRGKTESFVQVTYFCEKGVFTSEWRIRVKKTGKVDEVQMNVYDENGISICQKIKEVIDLNISNIGLSYDQFIKSVLLAQGDFSLFLKVSKKERSDLLEKITGTDIYRKLGQLAFEKNKEIQGQLKQWKEYKNTLESQVLPLEEIAEKEKVFKSYVIEIQNVDKELVSLEKQVEVQKKRNELAQKISKNKEAILIEENKQNLFNKEKGQKLERHQKTESFAQELLQWQDLEKNIVENKIILENEIKKEINFEQNKKSILQEISVFLNEDCLENSVLQQITKFHQEILSLEKEKEQKLSLYREEKARLDAVLKNIDVQEKNIFVIQEKVRYIENQALKKERQLMELLNNTDVKSVENEVLIQNKLLKNIQQAEKKSLEICLKKQVIHDIKEEEKMLESIISFLPNEIQILKKNQLEIEKYLDFLIVKKENEDLKKTLSDYRSKLIDGEPCPLCGALHHPLKEEKISENYLDVEIKNKQNELKENQKKLFSAENQFVEKTTRLNKIKDEFQKKENEIQKESQLFFEEFPMFSLDEKWGILQENTEKKIENLKEFQRNNTIILECKKAFPIILKLLEILREGQEIALVLERKIGKENISKKVELYKNKWNEIQKLIFVNQQKKSDLYEFIQQKQLQKDKIESKINSFLGIDFQSIIDAVNARLPFSEYSFYLQEKKEIEEKLQVLKTQNEVFEKEYSAFEKEKNIDIEIILSEIQKVTYRKTYLNSEISNLDFILRSNKEKQTKILELEQKIKQENKQNYTWELLNTLIGDSLGARFNQFAQDLTLQQLLFLANKQLEKLSMRYLLSQPLPNEDDSLIAIDKEMGNQRRSVKTLSGGETFILSLALALALSDLASNNVKISSLFIDEGFGTLDPDMLDQTLDTLERLQQESDKMIGVISHIDALKERITTQIQMKQKGSGFSYLEIIPKISN